MKGKYVACQYRCIDKRNDHTRLQQIIADLVVEAFKQAQVTSETQS